MASFRLVSVFILFGYCPFAAADGFLKHDPKTSRLNTVAGLDAEFQLAMATVMGCHSSSDSSLGQDRLVEVERVLAPMWRVLPKNDYGRVEWRMLRYVAHRFFLQQSSLLIRGLEPNRQVNESHASNAVIMDEQTAALTETVMQGKRASVGFTLDDAVALVATMEQLIFNSESSLLEKVYAYGKKSTKNVLTHAQLHGLLEDYMVHWMIGNEQDVIDILLSNRTLLDEEIPRWKAISGFMDGVIKSMEFSHQRSGSAQPGDGLVAMDHKYDFEHAHEVVGGITKTFASYWESECQHIKASLIELDKTGTGRVTLSEFYGANSDGEWRFGESEAYLRELGALDETMGTKQVIIPNYLQGASNCIVTTQHYYVCCVNECESVLNEIEEAIGQPVASADLVLEHLANATTYDDEALKLTDYLRNQLQKIAETHGGKVPLHGRLFAQWLHYVFPRECPFPHKSGTYQALSPTEYGENYLAADHEVSSHAAYRHLNATEQVVLEEAQWMSQWSEEEELIADYSAQMRAPWQRSNSFALIGVSGIALVVMVLRSVFNGSGKSSNNIFEYQPKAHFV